MSVQGDPAVSAEEADDGWVDGTVIRTFDGVVWFLCTYTIQRGTQRDGAAIHRFVPATVNRPNGIVILVESEFNDRYTDTEITFLYLPPED